MYNIVFYIILIILLVDFVSGMILDRLNIKSWQGRVPLEMKGIFDDDKYLKSQQYFLTNVRFGRVVSVFSLLTIVAMLCFHGFAWINALVSAKGRSEILISLFFFGILAFGFDLIQTPFSYYRTFVIEQKFGFNNTTLKLWIGDKFKSWFINGLIGGGLLALVVMFYQWTGRHFWLYAWGITVLFTVFFTMFYSNLIVPLFNKQTPMEEGELKERITGMCQRTGYALDNVYVIDGSKRSTKSNAYFSGLGPKKRIVIYDTLIRDLETDEIVAVLAHEIGHYKKHHSVYGLLISTLQTGLTLYLLSLFIGNPALSQALGVESPAFHTGLIGFALVFSPVSTFLGIGMNVFSRRNEFEADRFANELGFGHLLGSALKKMSAKHLTNLTPHPAYVFIHYSHPTLLKRLENLEKEGN